MDEGLLYRVPLFAALPPEELAKLRTGSRTVELAGGDFLFAEGEAGDRFYVVLRGRLEVVKAVGTKEERMLNRCGPGDYLGEVSLLEPRGVRTASVRALAPSTLLEMTREDFNSLLQRQPALAFHIAKVLSARLREADRLTKQDLEQKNRELDRAYRDLQAVQMQLIEKEKLEHELALAGRGSPA